MTVESLKAVIKEMIGAAFAEQAEESRKQASEQLAKGGSDVFAAMIKGARQQFESEPAKEDKGLMVGRLLRGLAAGKGNAREARDFVKEVWKDAKLADVFDKALGAGSAPGGGFLVPVEYSTEIISFLRARAVVRALGPQIMPMPSGTITIPKIASGVSGSYIGENSNMTSTQPSFGSLTLNYKKLGVVVPLSNDLIRFATPSADTIVRNDMVAAMAVREDLGFIRGDGTANTPKGIRNWIPVANVIAANGTVNLANVTHDLGQLVLALKNANIPMINMGWMFSPRTEIYLMTLLTTNGVYAFREEMMTGKLWGMPYRTTTQIPTNLGSGSDSEVYLVDFADVVIGQSEQIILDVSQEASYWDGSALQSTFAQDQSVIRAISLHDIGMRHDLAAAVLTTVQWL